MKRYKITYSTKGVVYNERIIEAPSLLNALYAFTNTFPDVEVNSIFACEVKSYV